MRGGVYVAVLLLVAACAGPPPSPYAGTPPPRPASASGGLSPADQAIRELRQDGGANAPGQGAGRGAGEAAASPYDIGGEGQLPSMPSQVSPAFRGL